MKIQKALFLLLNFALVSFVASAGGAKKISVKLDAKTGQYSVSSSETGWTFSGNVSQPLQNVKYSDGHDAEGAFHSVSFSWKSNNEYEAMIRWYATSPAVIFSLSIPQGANGQSPVAFPDFSKIPSSLFHFSYHDVNFSTPEFTLNQTSTPWLLFDHKNNACVISPASDFMVAKMTGDGNSKIASELNQEVKDLPKNFTHSTIMVFDKGIEKTWDDWGVALRKIYHRTRPANDADAVLKYYGYWTDNGADYYYDYDTSKGYEGTLLALKKHYEQKGIPLGYMQLDSWWYEKSIIDPDGNATADHKNKRLPSGPWNRYGGLMEYRADPYLFPNGLASFQKKLGVPLVTHNRWVDPSSPYHKMYKISGFAAIDPGYWKDIMNYIHQAGVVCYEQDWLNYIYLKSPQMHSDISVGNAFMDDMAGAAKSDGIDLQYCMAMPRHFLQGVKYNNLTTIRTSDDRFEMRKWKSFLFTSQLAFEMGIWPWCDVFKSPETGNMILADLSAGPVGTGDVIGKENKENILKTCRRDGILIKPDVPLLPLDQDYSEMAQKEGKPILAYTFTKHGNITTGYLFSFAEEETTTMDFGFSPSEMGFKGKVVVFNPSNGTVSKIDSDKKFSSSLPNEKYTYYIIAPVTSSGIAFLGDSSKITSTGKQRIASINSGDLDLKVKVLFAKGERQVVLQGYSENNISSDKGKVLWNPVNHLFSVSVSAPKTTRSVEVTFEEENQK
ncbi:MAG: hypothetical protein KGM16_17745 [Bacteroidota bacterium]|nr:hypothetical protein [Bacteroidota bacterium]